MDDLVDIKTLFAYPSTCFDVIATATNLVALIYFVKRRSELGNAFLSYLCMADIIVCISDGTFNTSFVIPAHFETFRDVTMAISSHISRCSILVSGTITIYLNILRTSAIIWPMLHFKKWRLNVSLIFIISTFVILETCFCIFYTYPVVKYVNKAQSGTDMIVPYPPDHPLHSVLSYSLLVGGVPILLLVLVCCIASTTKLLSKEKHLNGGNERQSKKEAAITVLILSVQYAVFNTCGLALLTVGIESFVKQLFDPDYEDDNMDHVIQHIGSSMLVMNAFFNPVIYFWRVKKMRHSLIKSTRKIFSKRNKAEQNNSLNNERNPS